MTPEELFKWLTLGTMGSQVVTGLAGAGRSSAERAYQQQQDLYNRQQAAREASMAWLKSQLQGQEGRAETLARLTPLGAEQGYAQRQALLGGMARNIAGMPLPSGYGGTFNPAAGMNLGSFNDAATAGSLGQYQRLRAGIDPNFQFMSLGNLGLGDAGTAADRSVADYAKTMGEQRLARENAMTQFLVDQSRAAGLGAQPAGQAGQGEAPKKKGSKWATVGRIAAAAAPFVASGMKNVSPQMMKTIQAASGAAQGALSGGGAGGAALGAVSGYMAPAVQPTGIGVRNAVLNPRAIGTIASAGLPGVYGTIGQMVSSQLRGYEPPAAVEQQQSPVARALPITGYQKPAPALALEDLAPTKEEVAIINASPKLPVPSPYTPSQSAGDLIRRQQEQDAFNIALQYPQGALLQRGIIESNTARIQQIDQELAQLKKPAANESTIDRVQRETRIAALEKQKAAAQTRVRETSQGPVGGLFAPVAPSPSSRVNPEAFAPTPKTRIRDLSQWQLGNMLDAQQQQEGWFTGSRSQRNNNPGNIKASKIVQGYPGYVGQDKDGFAIFNSYDTGRAAQARLLQSNSYRDLTIADAVNRWAGGGAPAAYTDALMNAILGKGASS